MGLSEHNHELVMPFVVVRSRGGPYDDDAYVAGWEACMVDDLLMFNAEALAKGLTVHTANLPQIDLLAMSRGYTMTALESVNPTWTRVAFEATTKLQERM